MDPTHVSADAPAIPDGARLASIGARAGAWLIDQLLVAIPSAVVAMIVLTSRIDLFTDPGPGAAEVERAIPAWSVLLPVVLRVVYDTVLVAWLGQTVGMMALRIQVRSGDGSRLPWWQAAIRAVVPGLAQVVPSIGVLLTAAVYLSASFDPQRRGLHDRAAGSLVLARPRPEIAPGPPGWYPPPGVPGWPPPTGSGPPPDEPGERGR